MFKDKVFPIILLILWVVSILFNTVLAASGLFAVGYTLLLLFDLVSKPEELHYLWGMFILLMVLEGVISTVTQWLSNVRLIRKVFSGGGE